MATRRYAGDGIVVHWDSSRCIHTSICVNALPQVFDSRARPWVRIDGADAEAIIEVVERCPSGALTYERPGGPPEEPRRPTTAMAVPNGPLVMKGDLRLLDNRTRQTVQETRVTLCRCGGSRNQPFCDNSHRNGSAGRDEAESPAEICPPQEEPFA
jgi:uncharacterized Fe-S cluster protein YjdI/CDGSH-type Zn-finger protein